MSLTSASYVREQQHHAPATLSPMKETPVPMNGKYTGVRSGLDGMKKKKKKKNNLPLAGSRTTTSRIVIPWPSHFTD